MSIAVMVGDHAREKAGMPPEWRWYTLSCVPPGGSELIAYVVKGAVAPLKTRGPGKGHPNWRLLDRATDRTVYITPAEHDAWLAAYEARTGNCFLCQGAARVMQSWSVTDGTKYRPCPRCAGTGKPQAATEERASP